MNCLDCLSSDSYPIGTIDIGFTPPQPSPYKAEGARKPPFIRGVEGVARDFDFHTLKRAEFHLPRVIYRKIICSIFPRSPP